MLNTASTSLRCCALLLALVGPAAANFYDVLQPQLLPPTGGCKNWADTPQYDKYWLHGRPPASAGNACAQQALGNPDANFNMSDMGSAAQAHTIS